MIAEDYITAWRLHAPWVSDHQVEQDLVISRALVEVFGVADMGRRLALRGGTALYKLHIHPAARYSEDIDIWCRWRPSRSATRSTRSVQCWTRGWASLAAT